MSDTGIEESTGHGTARDRVAALAAKQAEVQEAREEVRVWAAKNRIAVTTSIRDGSIHTRASYRDIPESAIRVLLDATAPTPAQEGD